MGSGCCFRAAGEPAMPPVRPVNVPRIGAIPCPPAPSLCAQHPWALPSPLSCCWQAVVGPARKPQPRRRRGHAACAARWRAAGQPGKRARRGPARPLRPLSARSARASWRPRPGLSRPQLVSRLRQVRRILPRDPAGEPRWLPPRQQATSTCVRRSRTTRQGRHRISAAGEQHQSVRPATGQAHQADRGSDINALLDRRPVRPVPVYELTPDHLHAGTKGGRSRVHLTHGLRSEHTAPSGDAISGSCREIDSQG
jgi:hypothetical protein